AGLGAKRSTCEGAPGRKRTMLCLARGVKWGLPRILEGKRADAARASLASMPARPTVPRPAESERRKSRRETGWGIRAKRSPRWCRAGRGRILREWRLSYTRVLARDRRRLDSARVVFGISRAR